MESQRNRKAGNKLMKRVFLAPAILAFFLSGCAQATPTVDPAQIQASAVAAASTMVALTQAAIPTPTQEPPTPLPSPTALPSPTLLALPTLDTSSFPTAAAPTAASSSSGTDDCNHLLDVAASGSQTAGVLIQNTTKGPVTFTMGLSTKNAWGQCGYMSWSNIPKGGNVFVRVPQTGAGPCYWVYAWVNDPKQPRTLSPGIAACMNNPDKWSFIVGYDTIQFRTP